MPSVICPSKALYWTSACIDVSPPASIALWAFKVGGYLAEGIEDGLGHSLCDLVYPQPTGQSPPAVCNVTRRVHNPLRGVSIEQRVVRARANQANIRSRLAHPRSCRGSTLLMKTSTGASRCARCRRSVSRGCHGLRARPWLGSPPCP